jgi:hypothetical protein
MLTAAQREAAALAREAADARAEAEAARAERRAAMAAPGPLASSAFEAPTRSAAETAKRAAQRSAEAKRRQAALEALRKVKDKEAGVEGADGARRPTLGEELALRGPASSPAAPGSPGKGRSWRGAN